MQDDEFEWDDAKALANVRKHGVGFDAARPVFVDLFACFLADQGSDEVRSTIIGHANGVLLTVVYVERPPRTRIISARKATKHEQKAYYLNQNAE